MCQYNILNRSNYWPIAQTTYLLCYKISHTTSTMYHYLHLNTYLHLDSNQWKYLGYFTPSQLRMFLHQYHALHNNKTDYCLQAIGIVLRIEIGLLYILSSMFHELQCCAVHEGCQDLNILASACCIGCKLVVSFSCVQQHKKFRLLLFSMGGGIQTRFFCKWSISKLQTKSSP